MNANLEVHDVPISGHEQHIMLRSYRPTFEKRILPIILYFHGGGFTNGASRKQTSLHHKWQNEFRLG
jgi:acetyl esterase/lipase